MKTKEEILKEATKRTLNINEGSPLHDAVMKAMEEYAQEQVKLFCQPAVMPHLFFVVARTSEEGWEQLSVGLPTYERAVAFRDEPFTKKRYPYAFVVCTINEV